MNLRAAAWPSAPVIRREAVANPGLVWPLMLAGLGWLLLAWGARGAEPLALCIGLDLPSFGRFRTNLDAMVFYADPLAILIEWMAMVAAMMLPLAAVGLGRLAMRSHRPQRPGLLLAAISGYLAVWILIGPLVVLAVFVLRAWAATAPDALWPVMAPFALAALWTLSPLRRRVLIAAHRVPLLFGSPTVQRLGAARYGGALG
ncbi:MAG: DUF2182 domain-containing protein, partial [Pseudomonadota bacterium]